MSLKQRTATGLIMGVVMISACLFSAMTCALLFLVINIFCLWELGTHLLTHDGTSFTNRLRHGAFVFIGSYLPILAAFVWIFGQPKLHWLVFFFPFLTAMLFLFELFGKSLKPFHNMAAMSLGLVYVSIPMSLAIWISSSPIEAFGGVGNHFMMAVFFMVWASDVFAYLLGSKIGKSKMFPRISPNKTWEGTFSGVAGAILTGYLCSLFFQQLDFSLSFWIGAACICTIFGILGDLVESMFKRSLGIKDSGNVLPGHGGFLDRFDAFIFVVPFIYTYIILYFQAW
ncbi:MAG: phosphatidate cytidylyltransferase [Aureispira sp.]